jgi:hypothetical protein
MYDRSGAGAVTSACDPGVDEVGVRPAMPREVGERLLEDQQYDKAFHDERGGLDPEPGALAVVATGGHPSTPFREQLREGHLAPGLVDRDGGAVGELGRAEHHLGLSDDPLEPSRVVLLAPGEVPGVGEPVQLGQDGMTWGA